MAVDMLGEQTRFTVFCKFFKSAVSLVNHLRAVADEFHFLRTHHRYETTESRTSKRTEYLKRALSTAITCSELTI